MEIFIIKYKIFNLTDIYFACFIIHETCYQYQPTEETNYFYYNKNCRTYIYSVYLSLYAHDR